MGEIIKRMKDGRFIGWYLRWVDLDGKRKQRASGQPTHAEAKRMLVEIEAKVARGRMGVPERDAKSILSISDLCERYLTEYDSPRIRNHDKWAYKLRIVLRPVLAQIGTHTASDFDHDDAERLRNRMIRAYASNTARGQLTAIGSVFAWAAKKRIIQTNAFTDVRKPRKESRIEYLSREDALRLIETADAKAQRSLRYAVLAIAVRLGLLGGMRAGEIFGLRWRDVDLERGVLMVAKSYKDVTKSGKPRTVPISDDLVEALRAWRPRCPATREGVVCPISHDKTASGGWHQASRRRPEIDTLYRAAALPVPAAPWHCLRHTFASLFMMSGGNILTLQRLMGHTDVKITMVYAHLDDAFVAAEARRVSLRR